MIPTVEECITESQWLLADAGGTQVFTSAVMLPAVKRAIRQLKAEMAANQIPRMKRVATYTLALGGTSLTPASVGITDFGELIEMEERASSTDRYTHMWETEKLPQRDMDSALHVFEWREDTFHFVGSTQARQLRITYLDSGEAPASGSIGIDGCLPFISARAAALIAPTRGYDERGRELAVEAAIELDKLIAPMIRKMQQTPVQPRPYGIRRQSDYLYSQPYIAAPLVTEGALAKLTITGTQDGENATFILNGIPHFVQIFRNGQLLAADVAYTRSGVTVVFNPGYIPQADDALEAWA
jgi:hypothetical protein